MAQTLTDKPIAIAADHRGVALKARLAGWLLANGYRVNDCGADSAAERADAMDYALRLERILETFLNTAALGDRYAARRERLSRLDASYL